MVIDDKNTRKITNIPVLKAWKRVFELIECFGKHPFDREELKTSVLALFSDGKEEKSVFRGMAIPTMRRLGLIVGFGEDIRLSPNGRLIFEAQKLRDILAHRALASIAFEIDRDEVGFIELIGKNKAIDKNGFVSICFSNLRTQNIPAAKERIRNWLVFLNMCGLLIVKEFISLNKEGVKIARDDLNPRPKKNSFKSVLLKAYDSLFRKSAGIKTQSLLSLREETSMIFLNQNRMILTENQFDFLLSEIPKSTGRYQMSFGRS